MQIGLIYTGLCLVILSSSPLFAQAPKDEAPPSYLVSVSLDIGSAKQLGFKPPFLAVTTGIDKPVGRHFEIGAGVAYSPSRKYVTNDGNGFAWNAEATWFPRWRVGISGGVGESYLWTSQFHKSGWLVYPSVTVRNSFGTMPGRFSITYVVPRGCVWAAECTLPANGIQSNRTQGPEFAQEFRAHELGPKYRIVVGGSLAFYHFCDQANPLVISPRTCHFAETLDASLALEFGGKGRWY